MYIRKEPHMKKEYLTLNSKCDNLPLSIAIFEPEEEVKGIVQFSHGMAEHKERYFPFMEYLASNGYASIINDHRGHGGSVKSEEDYGYLYDETSDFIVEDAYQMTLIAKEKFPGKPVCLFGHSMGSLVVRKYIKKYDEEIDKLIVCGSPSKNPLVGVALLLVALGKTFKGDKHRSKTINNLSVGAYSKKIKDSKSSSSWLSANEENIETYDADEMCGFVFTINGFKNLFKLMKQVYQHGGWQVRNKELPIWFIAGAEDPVIVDKKAWLDSQQLLKDEGYTNVTGKLYENMRHEVLNESSSDEVYSDVLAFLEG